jgi:hypothetical protein
VGDGGTPEKERPGNYFPDSPDGPLAESTIGPDYDPFPVPGTREDAPGISSVPDLLFLTCRIRLKTKSGFFKAYWLCRIPLI